MVTRTTNSAIDDVEFLVRSDHRVTALCALARRPQSRADLQAMTSVSQSTMGRMLREFEDRNWITREGREYEATELGTFVALAICDVIDHVETERKLRDVWQWLPGEADGFTLDMCSDAVVTVANADDPYRPVDRFLELVAEAGSARLLGLHIALLELCRDRLEREIVGGMETEAIVAPRIAQYSRDGHPEQFSAVLESGNLTIQIHDDLPGYGLSIFDDRIAISGYDPDNVTVRVLVDTDADAAREWAESVYESYGRQTPTVPIDTPAE